MQATQFRRLGHQIDARTAEVWWSDTNNQPVARHHVHDSAPGAHQRLCQEQGFMQQALPRRVAGAHDPVSDPWEWELPIESAQLEAIAKALRADFEGVRAGVR